MKRVWLGVALVLGVLPALQGEERPYLKLRASPPIVIHPAEVLFTAELKGPEVEEFYCPEVVWTWPDGTKSGEKGDCPPFEEREDYPRRWTKRRVLPVEGVYTVKVALERQGRVLALDKVDVEAK